LCLNILWKSLEYSNCLVSLILPNNFYNFNRRKKLERVINDDNYIFWENNPVNINKTKHRGYYSLLLTENCNRSFNKLFLHLKKYKYISIDIEQN